MITLYNNIPDQLLITTASEYEHYIFRIVNSRGNETIYNLPLHSYNERYTAIEMTGTLDKAAGEYTYYVYNADDENDVNYSNKKLLERGILKIISI